MKNLCVFYHDGTLDESFWGHIYNIGGGESCRISTYEMFRVMFGLIGITDLDRIFSPKKIATRNFHGQYFLDSDRLEQMCIRDSRYTGRTLANIYSTWFQTL